MNEPQDEALRCVKCGFCLQSCPTYRAWGIETHSPRGRLTVMRALFDGQLSAADALPALDTCLGCRACEPACPSGIQYGRVLEEARASLARAGVRPGGRVARWLTAIGLRHLLPHPGRLRLAAAGLRLLRRTGLAAPMARLLPGHLSTLMAAVPDAATPGQRRSWQQTAGLKQLPEGAGWLLPAHGPRRYRVAFLPGCVMDAVFWSVNRATLVVLQRTGCEVVIPNTTCCGALHAHSGENTQAVALALSTIEALDAAEAMAGAVDAIISNAGGCGAHLVEYGHLLGTAAAAGFAARVRDFSQWLDEVGPGPAILGPVPVVATYQESCHLANGMKVKQPPRRLLQQIPGLKLVEMADAAQCCGSAGIYNLTHPELAAELLDQKIQHVVATGAQLVVTANPGCHLQLRSALARRQPPVPVLHLAEVLEQSLLAGQTAATAR